MNFYPTRNFGHFWAALSKMSLTCVFLLSCFLARSPSFLSLRLTTTTETHDHRDTQTQQFSAGLIISAAMAMTVHIGYKLLSCTICTTQNSEIQGLSLCTSHIAQPTCPSSLGHADKLSDQSTLVSRWDSHLPLLHQVLVGWALLLVAPMTEQHLQPELGDHHHQVPNLNWKQRTRDLPLPSEAHLLLASSVMTAAGSKESSGSLCQSRRARRKLTRNCESVPCSQALNLACVLHTTRSK